MWIIVPLAISIIATGSGYLETVDAQQYWNYQDYPESPSYNTWSAPTENQENGLLQMVSRLCPNCLQSGGIDEVSGIPGLRNAIEYSYFNTIKPSINEMFDKYGIDRGATYRYADSLCNRNSQMISFLPGNDVVDMLCSDIHQTVQQENL
ncbi:uncharacterized protein LOC124366515 [Homalodisca vitripennis]|uniref:uncharacterized protein LOC124366515 n=1 Tax=Homalodisca vitripennis TaxID=197043 RepID=UPI001EEBD7EF|nr:uncharacterized protein LOC124366515 [Homalodisca vitripennis]